MSCQYGKVMKEWTEGGSRRGRCGKKGGRRKCPFVPNAGRFQAANGDLGSCPPVKHSRKRCDSLSPAEFPLEV